VLNKKFIYIKLFYENNTTKRRQVKPSICQTGTLSKIDIYLPITFAELDDLCDKVLAEGAGKVLWIVASAVKHCCQYK
jgi:hypothetical protein